ncbi:MAG: sigma-70 family RNA polymerase sigma factor [Clostridia bacterium]|nr:sigma-70 family RNA polymerase sigma factor [Clostridia bacterium]
MNRTTADMEKIYSEYHEKVLHYITQKVPNPHDAEDLVSCVFLKVYQKLETFDGNKASVSTWIYTITRNTVIDFYRTAKAFSEIPETLANDYSVDEKLINEETLEILYSALKRLDERSRDIIILHYYSGITLKEIARRMNMSYANVKVTHNKALNKLKKFMPGIC